MKKFITSEDVLGLKEIEGWRVSECNMSGTIEWDNFNGTFIYATPNWDEDGETPFAIFTEESGEYETVKTLSFDEGTSIEDQLKEYEQSIKNIIKII